jgi:Trk K+ transport system NAD-binding subunit
VLYALGRDGHFPRGLALLHRKYRTPHIALFICTVLVIVFGSSGIVKFVASLSDFGYLMGLGIVNYAVISLHRRKPNLRRPFKVALYPWVPILGVLTCWLFVPALERRSFILGGALTAVGGAVYLIRPANRPRLRVAPEMFSKFNRWLLIKRRERMQVLIIDGGKLGQNVANRLLARDEHRLMFRTSEHKITFIEQDEDRCLELEQRYHSPIYQGDGTKREILEQVGLDNIDVVVAASEDDGRNVIVALQAKRLGLNPVIAIVQDPDYLPLLQENGIVAISAPWATAAMVEDYLDRPGIAEIFEIGTGAASLVGVFVPEGAEIAEKKIRDIDIPDDVVVAAVLRQKDYVVPRGDTVIEEGDHVIFVGPASAVKRAHDMFMRKK